MNRLEKTRNLVLCALFAALTAVLSQIAIPIQPVPINLATFSVFVAGGVLGAKRGVISQAIYVLLGAVGLPVFASFSGGMGILFGPTGGYIFGYIAAAWLVGILSARCRGKIYWLALSMIGGLVLCYLLGTIWFIVSSHTGFIESLFLCVIPFLPGDAAKIVVASLLVPVLQKALSRTGTVTA